MRDLASIRLDFYHFQNGSDDCFWNVNAGDPRQSSKNQLNMEMRNLIIYLSRF